MANEFPNVLIVSWVEDGLSAIESFHAYAPDAVLMSLELPDMSGLRLLARMKQERADCVVVVLIDHAFPEIRRRCSELGTEHFFEIATEFEAALDVLKQACAPDIRLKGNG